MAERIEVSRKGKQLWLDGVMIAECLNDGVAAALQLSAIRGKVTRQEADLFMAVFNG